MHELAFPFAKFQTQRVLSTIRRHLAQRSLQNTKSFLLLSLAYVFLKFGLQEHLAIGVLQCARLRLGRPILLGDKRLEPSDRVRRIADLATDLFRSLGVELDQGVAPLVVAHGGLGVPLSLLAASIRLIASASRSSSIPGNPRHYSRVPSCRFSSDASVTGSLHE